MFDDANNNVVFLELCCESFDVPDRANVVDNEEQILKLLPVGEDVIVDLGYQFFLTASPAAEFDLDCNF